MSWLEEMSRSHENYIFKSVVFKIWPTQLFQSNLSQPQYKQENMSGLAVVEEPENPPSQGMHALIK